MPTVEQSILIAASPSEVSGVLLDIDAAPLWTSGLERLELIEGTLGKPDSLGHAHYVEGSRRYVVEDRLIEAVPGQRFTSAISGGGMKATVETTLDEIRGGTRLTIRWKGTGTNPVTKLVLPLMQRQVSRRTQRDLHALRDIVERRVQLQRDA